MKVRLRWGNLLVKLPLLNQINKACLIFIAAFSITLTAASAAPSEEFLKAERAYSSGDTNTAFQIWQTLSDKGDLDSQYYLAYLYLMFEIPSSEYSRLSQVGLSPQEVAILLLEGAAEKKHADSLTMIASFYERGFAKFEKNTDLAMEYREEAAATGDALAMYNLADALFKRSDKISQDRAYELYHKAAKQRFVLAFYPMGFIHFHRQTTDDLVMAYAWFQAILDWEPTDDVQGLTGQLQTIKSNAVIAMKKIEMSITPEQVSIAKFAALGLFED